MHHCVERSSTERGTRLGPCAHMLWERKRLPGRETVSSLHDATNGVQGYMAGSAVEEAVEQACRLWWRRAAAAATRSTFWAVPTGELPCRRHVDRRCRSGTVPEARSRRSARQCRAPLLSRHRIWGCIYPRSARSQLFVHSFESVKDVARLLGFACARGVGARRYDGASDVLRLCESSSTDP